MQKSHFCRPDSSRSGLFRPLGPLVPWKVTQNLTFLLHELILQVVAIWDILPGSWPILQLFRTNKVSTISNNVCYLILSFETSHSPSQLVLKPFLIISTSQVTMGQSWKFHFFHPFFSKAGFYPFIRCWHKIEHYFTKLFDYHDSVRVSEGSGVHFEQF